MSIKIFHLNSSVLFSDPLKFFIESANSKFLVTNYAYKDILILDLQEGCRAHIYLLGEGVIGEEGVIPGFTVIPEILKECKGAKIVGLLSGDIEPYEFESRGAIAFPVDSNSNELMSLIDSLLSK